MSDVSAIEQLSAYHLSCFTGQAGKVRKQARVYNVVIG